MAELTPADIAAVNRNDGGLFGGADGGGLFLFAILALMWGSNGAFGGRSGYGYEAGRVATVEDLNNSANFTRLEGQVMNNGNRIEQKADAIYSGICNLGYEIAQQFNNTNSQLAQCCCNTQKEILTSRYENSLGLAAVNANIASAERNILSKLDQNRIEALQDRADSLQGQINKLELQNALCGVVRYPNSMTYATLASPFCNCTTNTYAYGGAYGNTII